MSRFFVFLLKFSANDVTEFQFTEMFSLKEQGFVNSTEQQEVAYLSDPQN